MGRAETEALLERIDAVAGRKDSSGSEDEVCGPEKGKGTPSSKRSSGPDDGLASKFWKGCRAG